MMGKSRKNKNLWYLVAGICLMAGIGVAVHPMDVSALPFTVLAADTSTTADGLLYEFSSDGDEVAITGYEGKGPQVEIPKQIAGRPVTVIRKGAFTDNRTIQSLIIGENIKTIERYSCNRMENLRELSIPANVEKIGMSAFTGCSGLQKLKFEPGTKQLTIVCYAFTDCSALSDIDFSTRVIKGVNSDGNNGGSGNMFSRSAIEELNIPATADFSENFSAFEGCEKLKKVVIDAKKIRGSSFMNCKSLETVVLKNTESIDNNVFTRCESLEQIELPDTLKIMGSGVFSNCKKLTEITIPEGVEDLSGQTFAGCDNLEKVTLPKSMKAIHYQAFRGCTSLESIYLPAKVYELDSAAFQGCTNLKTFTVDLANQTFCVEDNVIYDKAKTTLIRGAMQLEHLDIPDTVTRIEEYAMTEMQNLKSVTIPAQVTEIGNSAFADSPSIQKVTFENGTNELRISGRGFENSSGLEELSFGNRPIKVTGIYLFHNTGLREVELPSNVDTEEGNGIFQFSRNLERVTISGDQKGSTLFYGCSLLKDLTLKNVTKIGASWFYDCAALENLELNEGLISIGKAAFENSGLKNVVFPESLQTIGKAAFEQTPLESLHLKKNVSFISLEAFTRCYQIREITVAEENPYYSAEDQMLFDKSKEMLIYLPRCGQELTEITIPESVKKIARGCFAGCGENLKWIAFEGNIPVTTVEAVDSNNTYSDGFGLYSLPDECYLFYNEAYPAWASLGSLSVPEEQRIPITEKMRTLKAQISAIDKNHVTADQRETLSDCQKEYRKLSTGEQIWIGDSSDLDLACSRSWGLYVKNLIQKLPAAEKLTWKQEDAVAEAKAQYEKLDEAGKTTVGAAMRLKLRNSEQKMREILRVTGFEQLPAVIQGVSGQTVKLSLKQNPVYAKYARMYCEVQDLNLAECTLSADGQTLECKLKKAGKTNIILHVSEPDQEEAMALELQIPILASLPVPQNVSAVRHGNSAEIKWQPVEQAASYRVFVSNDQKSWKECGNTKTLIFIHNDLAEGKNYYYRVQAIEASECNSSYSNVTAKITVPKTVVKPVPVKQIRLSAPAGVKVSNPSKKTVKLTWKKVKNATGYQIYRKTAGKKSYGKIKTIKKSATVKFLDKKRAKKTYYYKLRAYTRQNGKTIYSPWSKTVKIKVKK